MSTIQFCECTALTSYVPCSQRTYLAAHLSACHALTWGQRRV
jgi:hypothetical protein